jgi:hypothetical protein
MELASVDYKKVKEVPESSPFLHAIALFLLPPGGQGITYLCDTTKALQNALLLESGASGGGALGAQVILGNHRAVTVQ